MHKLPWLMFTCVFLSLIEASVADDGGVDLQKLQGTWIVTDAILAGERSPNVGPSKMVLARDQIRFVGKDGKVLERFRIELDSSKNPPTFDFYKKFGEVEKGPIRGIYLLEGGMLKICFNFWPNGERPMNFTSPKGSPIHIVTFSHAKRPVEKR